MIKGGVVSVIEGNEGNKRRIGMKKVGGREISCWIEVEKEGMRQNKGKETWHA